MAMAARGGDGVGRFVRVDFPAAGAAVRWTVLPFVDELSDARGGAGATP